MEKTYTRCLFIGICAAMYASAQDYQPATVVANLIPGNGDGTCISAVSEVFHRNIRDIIKHSGI